MPDITTTQIFSDGEKGITATKMNNIIANSVIQPDFVTAKPSSSTLDPTDQLLEVKGAGTYARITGSQLISSVSAQVDATPQIYSVRLRSFNAVGNSTFEVDQRNAAGSVAVQTGLPQDRWLIGKVGTMVGSGQQNAISPPVVVPGTNFAITRKFLRITCNTQETTLAAGDYYSVQHQIEGPVLRELISDVHSAQILVRSSVANLNFGLSICDPTGSRSLCKLCNIGPTANTWTLVSLPNLPVFPTAGAFSLIEGNLGYLFRIILASGSTYTSPANDSWQNGNFMGAVGQSNFFAQAVNSTIDFAFVQHEPGALCTMPIDCPFTRNYDECLRYYCKSYEYLTKFGTNTVTGVKAAQIGTNTGFALGTISFPKPMAKAPASLIFYAPDGTVNAVLPLGGSNISTGASLGLSMMGIYGMNLGAGAAANAGVQFHYTADTGW